MTADSVRAVPGQTPGAVAGYSGTLIAACAAVFVSQAISTLPASLNGLFQADLRTTGIQLTWITSAFMCAVVVFEFTFGVLGDLYGRKKLVLAGAALAMVGCTVSALAPTVQILWLGAAINGLGAGAMFPGSLSLVAAITHTPQQRAKVVAMWAGALSLAAAASPLAGGLISSGGNWRASYWFLLGIALVALVLTALLAVESSAPEGRKLDVPGQATFAIGLLLILFGIIQGPENGWFSPEIIGAFVLGVALLIAFVFIEKRAESPILNLDLFRNRAFTVSALSSLIGMFAFLGIGFSISIWMGPVQHQNPLFIALTFMIVQAPAFVFVPVISRLLNTVNPKWLLAGGFALLGIGAFLFSRADVTDGSFAPNILPAALVGVGFALSLSSMTAVALNTVPMHLVGMASATINMIRDLGFALGPAVIGTVAMTQAARAIGAGLGTLPPEVAGPAGGAFQAGGPFAVNGMPGPAHDLALNALGDGFSTGYLICAIAGILAAVIAVVGMAGLHAADTRPGSDELFDPQHPDIDHAAPVNVPLPVHPDQPGHERDAASDRH